MANEESNQQIISEVIIKIKELKIEVKKNEIKCFLSNEDDKLDCFLEIHAGAGGTESQDWAEMLRRMYIKWASNKDFKFQLISEHKGDEAGIKSSTIKISGEYIYGYLKNESGIHRLVRISPFDSGARRHTSFASVWVYPVLDENIEKSKSDIGWGHQIRSYVLHPYRLVKDNRTGEESTDPDKILDGDIDNFLESSLYKLNV